MMILNARRSVLSPALLVILLVHGTSAADEIQLATIEHADPVDFQTELLPILRKKCLACHNETDAESDLVLENPQTIAKGGSSGDAVVAGDPDGSLLLQLAAHRQDPVMPPEDNASGAPPMTPEELALLALWIQQGATGEVSDAGRVIQWQALPSGVRPIFAAAQTRDGRYVAAGRANQVWIYDLTLGNYVDQLIDTNLNDSPVAQSGGITHLDLVQALSFDDQNQWLATGGYRTVKLWQQAPRDTRSFPTEIDAVRAAAMRGDRTYIVSATGNVQSYEGGTRADVEFPPADHIAVADNGTIATSREANVQLVSANGQAAGQVTVASNVSQLVWLDDSQLAAGGDDGSIHVWRVKDGQFNEPQALKQHAKSITAIIGLGSKLVSGSTDGVIHVWNLESGKTEKQYNHGAAVSALTGAGDRFISAGGDTAAKVWTLESDKAVVELLGRPDLKWTLTRQTLAQQVAKRHVDNANADLAAAKKRVEEEEANLKKTIETRDKATEEQKKAKAADEKAKSELAAAEKEKADVDAELKAAEKAKVEADDDETKKTLEQTVKALQDRANKKVAEALKAKQEAAEKAAAELTQKSKGLESSIRSVETSEQASAAAKERAKALDPVLATVQVLLKQAEEQLQAANEALKSHQYFATRLATAPNGKLVGATSSDGIVQLYRADTGVCFDQFAAEAECQWIGFPSDSEVQVVTTDGRILRWQLATQWRLASVVGSVDGDSPFADRVTALAFSPDGKHLAVGGGEPSRGGQLQIIDVEQGTLLREIEDAHSDTVFGVAFSPDGKQLASCGADRFMKVFDVESGAHVRTFEGHTHHVLSVGWRADGRVLATGGADKVVKIWNTVDGSQIKTIQGFGKEVAALQFAGTTDDFFAACGDHNVYRCNVGGDRKAIGKASDFLYAVSTNAVGERVAFAGHDSVLRIVDREGKQVTELKPAP